MGRRRSTTARARSPAGCGTSVSPRATASSCSPATARRSTCSTARSGGPAPWSRPPSSCSRSAICDHVVRDSGARAVVAEAAEVERALAAAVGTGAAVVTLGDDAPDGVTTLAALERAEPAPIADRDDDDLAALLYTGGTTGRAKGVMLSHANLWFSGASRAEVTYAPGHHPHAADAAAVAQLRRRRHGRGAALARAARDRDAAVVRRRRTSSPWPSASASTTPPSCPPWCRRCSSSRSGATTCASCATWSAGRRHCRLTSAPVPPASARRRAARGLRADGGLGLRVGDAARAGARGLGRPPRPALRGPHPGGRRGRVPFARS